MQSDTDVYHVTADISREGTPAALCRTLSITRDWTAMLLLL